MLKIIKFKNLSIWNLFGNWKLKIGNSKNGFTLIEVLLSVMLIAVIIGISAPIYYSYQVKNDLEVTANYLAQTLRQAQVLARAVDGDSSWGVSTRNQKITLFKGAAFAGHDTSRDEIYDIPPSVTASVTDIIFTKFAGDTTTSNISLTSSNGSKTVSVNTKGVVSY